MIPADLHMHTCFSHGEATPFEMHLAASAKNLQVIGFSEHSPRPLGYDYSREYRDRLQNHFDDYIYQVIALKKLSTGGHGCKVLLGLEVDWLDGQEDFIRSMIAGNDFDYLIGSVHFLDHWGFDDSPLPWASLSQEECEALYTRYFDAWRRMLQSRLFQIAAHPDLIKIFSVERFHAWLEKPEARTLIYECLRVLQESGMCMEVSSAGLRKPCAEIYPAPAIMRMAREIGVPITISSDAHNPRDIGHAFPELVAYAGEFGYSTQTFYARGCPVARFL